jgi:hypothetical protein
MSGVITAYLPLIDFCFRVFREFWRGGDPLKKFSEQLSFVKYLPFRKIFEFNLLSFGRVKQLPDMGSGRRGFKMGD